MAPRSGEAAGPAKRSRSANAVNGRCSSCGSGPAFSGEAGLWPDERPGGVCGKEGGAASAKQPAGSVLPEVPNSEMADNTLATSPGLTATDVQGSSSVTLLSSTMPGFAWFRRFSMFARSWETSSPSPVITLVMRSEQWRSCFILTAMRSSLANKHCVFSTYSSSSFCASSSPRAWTADVNLAKTSWRCSFDWFHVSVRRERTPHTLCCSAPRSSNRLSTKARDSFNRRVKSSPAFWAWSSTPPPEQLVDVPIEFWRWKLVGNWLAHSQTGLFGLEGQHFLRHSGQTILSPLALTVAATCRCRQARQNVCRHGNALGTWSSSRQIAHCSLAVPDAQLLFSAAAMLQFLVSSPGGSKHKKVQTNAYLF